MYVNINVSALALFTAALLLQENIVLSATPAAVNAPTHLIAFGQFTVVDGSPEPHVWTSLNVNAVSQVITAAFLS